MKSYLAIFFLLIGYNQCIASNDSIILHISNRIQFSFCIDDFKKELKKEPGKSNQSYDEMLDSLVDNSINMISNSTISKYGKIIEFENALIELYFKGKLSLIIDQNKINYNLIRTYKKYSKCCISREDLKENKLTTHRKKYACGKKLYFKFNGETVASLYIESYNRMINCI
ncbi:MAG: hypothetical protein ACI9N1_002927 [Flavobacteriales bacterium]|jgi:hypothetical protein